MHKLCDPANLYTSDGREKTQEEFVGWRKALTAREVQYWN